MNSHELRQRLQIGFALIVGYFSGKGLSHLLGHHPSESFVVGSLFGVLITQGFFWGWGRWFQRPGRKIPQQTGLP